MIAVPACGLWVGFQSGNLTNNTSLRPLAVSVAPTEFTYGTYVHLTFISSEAYLNPTNLKLINLQAKAA